MGLGSTFSFLGKQQIHEMKTVGEGEVRVEQSKPSVVSPALGLDITSVCRRLFVSGPVLIYLFICAFYFECLPKKAQGKKKGFFNQTQEKSSGVDELMFACCA